MCNCECRCNCFKTRDVPSAMAGPMRRKKSYEIDAPDLVVESNSEQTPTRSIYFYIALVCISVAAACAILLPASNG